MTEHTPKFIDYKADSQSFDGVAEMYDRYRPSYPIELIEDILNISGLQPDGRILEIGSGTGKATILFAQRGYSILCLEPGQNLIYVAARNLAAYPRVSFVNARFEEWDSHDEMFDLVISAQAYHWVPENVRYEKTARVLKPGGYLAAFWNMYPGMEGVLRQELDQAYVDQAPELVMPEKPIDQLIEERANSLRLSPYFEHVVIKQVPWSIRYSTREYMGLLNTYSDHLRLSEQKRAKLLDVITGVIEKNGGYIDRPYLAVVYMARRSG